MPLVTNIASFSENNTGVYAIQYESNKPGQGKLPPAIANIFFQPISINRAAKETLNALPGIGPVLAERIVLEREDRGPFRSNDELLHIKGLGPKKLARLIDYITLD